jgi:hypothetical protein
LGKPFCFGYTAKGNNTKCRYDQKSEPPLHLDTQLRNILAGALNINLIPIFCLVAYSVLCA